MIEVSENFSETTAPDLATEATWRRLGAVVLSLNSSAALMTM